VINKKRKTTDEVKMNPAHKTILIVLMSIFILYSITLIFPFLWLFLNSLKGKVEFGMNNPFSLPESPFANGFANYKEMFTVFPLVEMFLNSILLSVICPTVSAFFTVCAAYAVSKFDFALRKPIYFIGMMVIFVNIAGGLAAQYKLMDGLNLMDTLPGMILLTSGAFGFNFLLMTGTFQGVSNTYREAALIDGAGEWRIFLGIYVPMVMPTVSAIWLLGFIGQWNDYVGVSIFYSSHETLSTGIKKISDSIDTGKYMHEYPKLFAAMIISIVPIVTLFACFQKQIMKLNLGGGIKE